MKRNIVLAVMLTVLLFASCKNEDIAMQRKVIVNFTIDPFKVINGFTYEVDTGELKSFSPNHKLRIHLLVYDEMGSLKETITDNLSNYQENMNSSLWLWEGEYTAVAITDVVKYDGGDTSNYWNITETEHLSSLKVSDAENLGGNDEGNLDGKYKILGISKYHFNVGEGGVDDTIRIGVEPAGALIVVESSNIHYYNTVLRYKLGMNKNSDYCTFNSDGSPIVVVENGGENYEWHSGYFDPQDYNSSNEHHYYHFLLPLGKTAFQWMGKTDDNIWPYAGDKMSANIGHGEEYLVRFDLGSDIKAQMELVNGGKATE